MALDGCQTQGRRSAFHPARPVSSASSLSPSREIHPFREGHSRCFPELLVSSPEPPQCSFCRCWKCPCRDGRCLLDRSPFCSVLPCQWVTCAPLLPAVAVTVRTLHRPRAFPSSLLDVPLAHTDANMWMAARAIVSGSLLASRRLLCGAYVTPIRVLCPLPACSQEYPPDPSSEISADLLLGTAQGLVTQEYQTT